MVFFPWQLTRVRVKEVEIGLLSSADVDSSRLMYPPLMQAALKIDVKRQL